MLNIIRIIVMLTIKSADVFHRDLAMSPNGGHNRMQFPSFEPSKRHSEILTIHYKC